MTGDNVDDFLAARLRDRVFDGRRRSLDAFLKGVYGVVPRVCIMLLSARELELVLFGALSASPLTPFAATTASARWRGLH